MANPAVRSIETLLELKLPPISAIDTPRGHKPQPTTSEQNYFVWDDIVELHPWEEFSYDNIMHKYRELLQCSGGVPDQFSPIEGKLHSEAEFRDQGVPVIMPFVNRMLNYSLLPPSHPIIVSEIVKHLTVQELMPIVAALDPSVRQKAIIDASGPTHNYVRGLPPDQQTVVIRQLVEDLFNKKRFSERCLLSDPTDERRLLFVATGHLMDAELSYIIRELRPRSPHHEACVRELPLHAKLDAMLYTIPPQDQDRVLQMVMIANPSLPDIMRVIIGEDVVVDGFTFDDHFFRVPSPAEHFHSDDHYERIATVTGITQLRPTMFPDVSAIHLSDPLPARLQGDYKFSLHWQPTWSEDDNLVEYFFQGLSQVYCYMNRSETRYGFLLCDAGLRCFRRSVNTNGVARNGHLDIAEPILWDASGPQLTIRNAIWAIAMEAAKRDEWRLASTLWVDGKKQNDRRHDP